MLILIENHDNVMHVIIIYTLNIYINTVLFISIVTVRPFLLFMLCNKEIWV